MLIWIEVVTWNHRERLNNTACVSKWNNVGQCGKSRLSPTFFHLTRHPLSHRTHLPPHSGLIKYPHTILSHCLFHLPFVQLYSLQEQQPRCILISWETRADCNTAFSPVDEMLLKSFLRPGLYFLDFANTMHPHKLINRRMHDSPAV